MNTQVLYFDGKFHRGLGLEHGVSSMVTRPGSRLGSNPRFAGEFTTNLTALSTVRNLAPCQQVIIPKEPVKIWEHFVQGSNFCKVYRS